MATQRSAFLWAFSVAGMLAAGCTPEQSSHPDAGASAAAPASPPKTLVLYAEAPLQDEPFAPSGWLGDFEDAVELDAECADKPHAGKTCLQVTYDGLGDCEWAGLYWLHPKGNWAQAPGRDLTNAAELTFWARGDEGGEVVTFKMGGVRGPHADTAEAATPKLTLTSEWNLFTIDLTGADLSNVVGGFAFVVTKRDNPEGCTFYLDDVAYVFKP